MIRHLKLGLIVFGGIVGAIILLILAWVVSEFAEQIIVNSRYPSESEYYTMARSRIKIGDQRDKAVRALSDAWYHGECNYLSGMEPHFIDDVFFYGPPNNLEQARIVIVRSEPIDGMLVVSDIGTIENYMLSIYEECIPMESIQSN